mgnify:CR=1 FL=1
MARLGRRPVYEAREKQGISISRAMWDALSIAADARGMSRNLLIVKVLGAWLAQYAPEPAQEVPA